MPKGLQDYSAKESVSPYIKAVVATTSDMDACRAVHMKGSSAEVTLTVNGADVAFYLLQGHIYPICATKASANTVVFLY
tara:strand:- start:567 stop:803 length:237 start_codon:yes stop_codon:yes gene_type:complete